MLHIRDVWGVVIRANNRSYRKWETAHLTHNPWPETFRYLRTWSFTKKLKRWSLIGQKSRPFNPVCGFGSGTRQKPESSLDNHRAAPPTLPLAGANPSVIQLIIVGAKLPARTGTDRWRPVAASVRTNPATIPPGPARDARPVPARPHRSDGWPVGWTCFNHDRWSLATYRASVGKLFFCQPYLETVGDGLVWHTNSFDSTRFDTDDNRITVF